MNIILTNLNVMIENKCGYSITFLNVFVSGIDNQNLIFQSYHKPNYTELSEVLRVLHWNFFHNEIKKIINLTLLKMNIYFF